MSKFAQKQQEAPKPSYSRDDYDQLRAGMKKYKTDLKDRTKLTSFLQYMAELGVIRYDLREAAGYVVCSPVELTKQNNLRAKLEAYDDVKLQEVLDTMPEEKESYLARREKLIHSIRLARTYTSAIMDREDY